MKTLVKYVRKQMGIKQQDLAKMAGVSRQTISSIEKGRYNPSLFLAYKISLILECKNMEEIFFLDESNVFKEGELEKLKTELHEKNLKKENTQKKSKISSNGPVNTI